MDGSYTQRFRFTGKDGSLGYRTGKVYQLVIWHPNDYAVVIERPGGSGRCPYSTVGSFMENWESPGEEEE